MRQIFRIALWSFASVTACAFAQQNLPKASYSTAPKDTVVLVSLFKPVYPPLARQTNITGKVSVTVTVHKDGTTEVVVESGHPLLQQAALDSAKQSHFECRDCSKPLSYLMEYTFEKTSRGNCCSAFSSPTEVEQELPTINAQGQPLTHITISTEQICFCDPAATTRVRSLRCLYLWKCRSKF